MLRRSFRYRARGALEALPCVGMKLDVGSITFRKLSHEQKTFGSPARSILRFDGGNKDSNKIHPDGYDGPDGTSLSGSNSAGTLLRTTPDDLRNPRDRLRRGS